MMWACYFLNICQFNRWQLICPCFNWISLTTKMWKVLENGCQSLSFFVPIFIWGIIFHSTSIFWAPTCATSHSRCWEFFNEQNKQNPCPPETPILAWISVLRDGHGRGIGYFIILCNCFSSCLSSASRCVYLGGRSKWGYRVWHRISEMDPDLYSKILSFHIWGHRAGPQRNVQVHTKPVTKRDPAVSSLDNWKQNPL